MAGIGGDRGTGQASDPALETGLDHRRQLQVRLSRFGQVLTAASFAYWIGFVALWSGEPSIGLDGAIDLVVSIPNAVLAVTYASLWLVTRGRALSVRTLRNLDAAVVLTFGSCWGFGWVIAPVQPVLTLDYLLGIQLVLILRALLVPSSWQRTATIGALTVVPILISVVGWSERFHPLPVTHRTLVGIYLMWSLLAIALSSVGSAILYGLRRELRDARRLGQYTLLEPIGAGGMGVVYRASHAMLRRPTAVKLITADGEPSIDRFEREVQHMASLAHPNIVTVYDYGRTHDGTLYYAMELLDGIDLERIVELGGPLPASRVVFLLTQACRALAGAHAAGLVHRDIKPANLFVCRDWGTADALKILDFGLVKDLRGGATSPLTHQGTIMGTPLYMAPESWMSPETVDARSDLYSLGAVACFLLTGKPVFDGKNPFEVMVHHTQTPPAPPSRRGVSVPPDLDAIILRCLAKDPADRFASADLLRAHLEGCELANAWSSSDARDWWHLHPRIAPPHRPTAAPPGRQPLFVARGRREPGDEPGTASTAHAPP
ncbi:MAG TPA: serine/threonine-protein kinase [Kofleriaceae bacterium]|nr:serine/threonine-protein kinase [Kofleriaceae bacterium]